MKITDVKTFVIDAFRTNWTFVKVETDEQVVQSAFKVAVVSAVDVGSVWILVLLVVRDGDTLLVKKLLKHFDEVTDRFEPFRVRIRETGVITAVVTQVRDIGAGNKHHVEHLHFTNYYNEMT